MGFYLREGISVGPVRFNLSKSGVGVSIGVTGARMGVGPKGGYVHVGKGPIRYRKYKQLGSSGSSTVHKPNQRDRSSKQEDVEGLDERREDLRDVEVEVEGSLAEADAKTIVQEINTAKSHSRFWPWIAVLSIIATISAGGAESMPAWAVIPVGIAGVLGTALAHQRDKVRKTVALFYDFEETPQQHYEQVCDIFDSASQSEKIWSVGEEAILSDQKRNASAKVEIPLTETKVGFGPPSSVKTNIPVPSILTEESGLHFLPDQLLIEHDETVEAVSYQNVEISVSKIGLVLSEAPGDAPVIDRTWKYVNKDGSRDSRFNDNRKLEVVGVDKLEISEKYGDAVELIFSGKGEAFKVGFAINSLPVRREQESPNEWHAMTEIFSHSEKERREMIRIAKHERDNLELADRLRREIDNVDNRKYKDVSVRFISDNISYKSKNEKYIDKFRNMNSSDKKKVIERVEKEDKDAAEALRGLWRLQRSAEEMKENTREIKRLLDQSE